MAKRFLTLRNAIRPASSILIVSLMLSVFALVIALPDEQTARAAGTTYYVDCQSGNDSYGGTSPSQAWRSMDRANAAPLVPGDRLLFQRGCTWTQRLEASWHGASGQPILIGAFGAGDLPQIKNGLNQNVNITGSYLIMEYLHAHTDLLKVDPNCSNQPYGYHQVGFNFREGSAYNTLRYSKASGNMAGVKIHFESHHNTVNHNTLVNNNVLHILDSTNPDNDLGAWGILVNGNYNEFAYNFFENNNAWCSYDFGHSGNSIELFGAQHNTIHHNISINDETFSELGGSSDRHSEDNVYAYNLFASSTSRARFIIVSGVKDTKWGPTYGTTVVNNTVYLTAGNSQGVVCWAGCSSAVLTLRNNILWAEEKSAFADAPFTEDHNIYWSSDGTPFVQFMDFNMEPTSKIADPQFVDRLNGNFQLQSSSPAIDGGANMNWGKDLAGKSVPQGAGFDLGAYEYQEPGTTPPSPPIGAQSHIFLSIIQH